MPINIQNTDDNECLKWSIVRCLNPEDCNLARTIFIKSKKRIPLALGFLVMKIKKTNPVYVSKQCSEEQHVDLLLIGKEGKRHYILIKDFNISCMIIHYIVEENIFVVVAYKL